MKIDIKVFGIAVLVGLLWVQLSSAAVTNTVPWSDSFESYTNGASIVGTNGWTGPASSPASGMASTDPTILAALMTYTSAPAAGLSFPLSVTHTTVLQTTTMSTNEVHSATGGVVTVEFMSLPSVQDVQPANPANLYYAFYVDTNFNLVIWHQNRTGGTTNNEWRAMTTGPVIATNAWSRFTVVQDYIHNMFQIRVSETNTVTDPVGWSSPGGTQSGSWFFMTKTNASLSQVMVGGDDTYFDDLMLTNRVVIWSTNRFMENGANDGTINPNPSFDMALSYDTFTGTNGQVLDGSAVTVTNVPAGLTGVVSRLDATHLRLTLTGTAVPNESINGVSNLTVVLKDSAFSLGSAADVAGASNNTIGVSFMDHAALALSRTNFVEAAANDGSISNTINVTLISTAFTNTSPLIAGTHYTIANVPQGLAFSMTRSDATTAVAHLTGNAAAHRAVESTNMNLAFLDAAFPGMAAANVFGSATNLAVTFADQPVLAYSSTNFAESAASDGSIGNTIAITLTGDTFTNLPSFTNGVQYVAPAVPVGLTLVLSRTSPTTITASLTNAANAHAALNSLSSIGFAFLSPAFSNVAASNIVGSITNLAVTFSNPPVVSAVSTGFFESAANNGSIGNSNTVTLSGAAFATGPFVSNTHFTVSNVPVGLVFGFNRDSASQLTATLTGQASNHLSANSITNLTVTFLNGAFNGVLASNIVGYPLTYAVTFSNQPSLTYSGNTFTEASAGLIDNRTPLTITLAGDTYAADVTNRIAVANMPGVLTAAFTRDTPTQISVRLNGMATNNASSDSISNLTFTFQAGAFTLSDYNQVDNYVKNNLRVTFIDDPGFFNFVPYIEPFEGYANGFWLAGTNGWTADYYAGAGVVTNDAVVTANLTNSLPTNHEFPIVTNHTQVLSVNDVLRTRINSETNKLVYVDFMTQPSVISAAWDPPTPTCSMRFM